MGLAEMLLEALKWPDGDLFNELTRNKLIFGHLLNKTS